MRMVAFFSYTRHDDADSNGRLSWIRETLERKLRTTLGFPVQVFQDTDDLKAGQNWRKRIQEALESTVFLVVMITPSFFESEACQEELQRFHERAQKLGYDDLIIPIYWTKDHLLAKAYEEKKQPLHRGRRIINELQYLDWRRLSSPETPTARLEAEVMTLAEIIGERLYDLEERMKKAPAADTSAPQGGGGTTITISDGSVTGDIVGRDKIGKW